MTTDWSSFPLLFLLPVTISAYIMKEVSKPMRRRR